MYMHCMFYDAWVGIYSFHYDFDCPMLQFGNLFHFSSILVEHTKMMYQIVMYFQIYS